jgi:hypothetical protein
MSDSISIWSKYSGGEYNDKKIFETDNILIIKYFGQQSGKNDKFLDVGNFFFYKNENKSSEYWKFAGKTIKVTNLCKENGINVYELVISKEPELCFRIKNDACLNFRWSMLNDYERTSGIIKHKNI